MKKWMKICLIVLCVVILWEAAAWLWGFRISPLEVEYIEVCTCVEQYSDHRVDYAVDYLKLSEDEIWKFVMLHNLSFYTDKFMGDSPPESDGIEIRFKSGRRMWIDPYRGSRIHVKPGYYVMYNPLLCNYIQQLLAEHNLPAW